MNYQSVLDQIEAFVSAQLSAYGEPLAYHNLNHTRNVVSNAAQIAAHYQLSAPDQFVVLSASWFHDLGYVNGDPAGHEQRGALIFREFANSLLIEGDLIAHVIGCILATTLPQKPTNLLESIVCDADLYHFGTSEFAGKDLLMLEETSHRLKTDFPAASWLAGSAKLLRSHQFCTSYCQDKLTDQKQDNLRQLEARMGTASRADQ
ncbi:HD domain-containing protein [Dyadobacter koreensis]|uniref:HD domain-containing protein n=1 Tax=Dyadobacter koreensis TaxID=408657 RepID=A0A1H7AU88_9BACT|nr:HD domain-containing protein [Dyadobacter koreensis]SEJ68516.1 HD domain-containing protein [Dyadobacter koreensis]